MEVVTVSASTFERVKKVVVDSLGVDADEVTADASFVDLGADSLDQVELIMAFEDAFEIEIPDEVAEKIVTVEDAVRKIEEIEKEAGNA